jgi:serine/threonine protein kinase
MSAEARSFIDKLLKKNPEERLKSEDLLEHPFLKNAGK